MKASAVSAILIAGLVSACGGEPVQEESSEQAESLVPEILLQPALERDRAVEAAILVAAPDYTRQMVDVGGGQKARYLYARADLNGDGREEVFVYLLGSYFCGTGGCNLLVLTETESGYSVVNNFTTTDLPVVVSREETNGWSDLIRHVRGGGVPAEYVRHTFDGTRYTEKERMSADAAPVGEAYLADEFTFEDGILLEPPG